MLDGVVLGFDFGMVRTGVAIANSITRSAQPLTTITARSADLRWSAIGELIARWHPVQLVVGIPRHPDGKPNEMTARCERFARQLEGRFRVPVARVDERYSTVAAEGQSDDGAAALVLQQWIDEGPHDA